MGVAVTQRRMMQQRSMLTQHFHHMGIGLVNLLTFKEFGSADKAAVGADRVFNSQAVFHSNREIFLTMTGSRVNSACT